ncbi:MAG: hypothetical protein F4139_08560, partial [Gemmatimonadetes bacterium]|nr:hypothetical protein [Gemmatimonadota bacterium]MYK66456.1 hypothetical protein [Gemmatimonadota bacterium]
MLTTGCTRSRPRWDCFPPGLPRPRSSSNRVRTTTGKRTRVTRRRPRRPRSAKPSCWRSSRSSRTSEVRSPSVSVVYLNGDYLRADEAKISVNDRGFLFGDGVYEVTPAYHGRLFRWAQHLTRMRRGLAALGIDFDAAALEEVKKGLLARNGLDDAPAAYIYVQVTRGVAPRTHAFPNPP